MPERCKKGTRRNKKTGNCESTANKQTRARCPKGTRRNKKTGNCESNAPRADVPGMKLQTDVRLQPDVRRRAKERCKKGTRRNKITGNCEPVAGVIVHSHPHSAAYISVHSPSVHSLASMHSPVHSVHSPVHSVHSPVHSVHSPSVHSQVPAYLSVKALNTHSPSSENSYSSATFKFVVKQTKFMKLISNPNFDRQQAERLITNDETEFDAINQDGKTELMLAFETGDSKLVDKLFKLILNDLSDEYRYWQHVDKDNRNVLIYACKYQNKLVVDALLVREGNDAGIVDKHGNTPLLYLCNHLLELEELDKVTSADFKNTVSIIKAILEFREDTNINVMATNSDGKTALHILCSFKFRGQEYPINLLVDEKYDDTLELLNMKDNTGRDAYSYAVENKIKNVIRNMQWIRNNSEDTYSSSSFRSGDYY